LSGRNFLFLVAFALLDLIEGRIDPSSFNPAKIKYRLIQEGYLMRTSRGREATELAYKHLNRLKSAQSGTLF
jgi:hypothetical protein